MGLSWLDDSCIQLALVVLLCEPTGRGSNHLLCVFRLPNPLAEIFTTTTQFEAFEIPKNSALRQAPEVFWSIRVNDEGVGKPDNFFKLANAGRIELLAPHRAKSFGKDGKSIILDDGQIIKADVIILCTGYQSSWTKIFDRKFPCSTI